MPLTTTRHETAKILSGEADGVTRAYPNGACPHIVGEKMLLCVEHNGKTTPYAEAVIKSMRPGKADHRRTDDRLAKADGYSCAEAWYANYVQTYGTNPPEDVVRIQFNVTKKYDGRDGNPAEIRD